MQKGFDCFTMKTEILCILKSQPGKFISGEELANTFGVSRAAVWKAIASLRNDGHKIIASTNKGYSLAKSADILSENGILQNLRPDTKISRVLCFDEIDSTNNYAKKLRQETRNVRFASWDSDSCESPDFRSWKARPHFRVPRRNRAVYVADTPAKNRGRTFPDDYDC